MVQCNASASDCCDFVRDKYSVDARLQIWRSHGWNCNKLPCVYPNYTPHEAWRQDGLEASFRALRILPIGTELRFNNLLASRRRIRPPHWIFRDDCWLKMSRSWRSKAVYSGCDSETFAAWCLFWMRSMTRRDQPGCRVHQGQFPDSCLAFFVEMTAANNAVCSAAWFQLLHGVGWSQNWKDTLIFAQGNCLCFVSQQLFLSILCPHYWHTATSASKNRSCRDAITFLCGIDVPAGNVLIDMISGVLFVSPYFRAQEFRDNNGLEGSITPVWSAAARAVFKGRAPSVAASIAILDVLAQFSSIRK